MTATSFYQSIRCVRGIAAMLVVLHHIPQLLQARVSNPASWSFEFGAFGVDVFFVISGFVMMGAAPASSGIQGAASFLLRRVARIVPLYWCVTVAITLIWFASPALFSGYSADLPRLVRSLLFLPLHNDAGHIRPLLAQGWTLSYEMYFYLLFAIVVGSGTGRRAWRVSALILSLGVLGRLFLTPRPDWIVNSAMPLEFLMGCAIWSCRHRLSSPMTGALALGSAAGGLAMAALVGVVPGEVDMLRVLYFGVPAALLVAAAIAFETSWRHVAAWLGPVGDSSYSLYLVHGIAFSVVWKLARILNPSQLSWSILLFGGAIVAGWMIHLAVEKPLYRIGMASVRHIERRLFDAAKYPAGGLNHPRAGG